MSKNMPSLYVIATPIGNLEDITFRAVKILKEVSLIAAEDTRNTRKLLNAYDIKTPATSYHEHNKLTKLDYILSLLENSDIAMVSDAGMPGISDPGYELIREVSKHGIPVIPIPGPSALVSSIAVSGLPADKFLYLGFLPHKRGDRAKILTDRKNEKATLVFYEAPHRIQYSLRDMLDILGNREVAICRELTKIHEEIYRGHLEDAIEHFNSPRGEFTIVVEGQTEIIQSVLTDDIKSDILHLMKSGLKAKDAVNILSNGTGLSKKELYKVWLNLKGGA
jgi:16S rRNA (cytidine1402-2'-O)-methyltransferase